MQRFVLISCVKSKLDHPAKAKDLYTSPLFRFNLEYAKKLNPNAIYILSAKYGLLELEQNISPYEKTLNTMSEQEKRTWAKKVIATLNQKTNIRTDLFIFLAGKNYRKYLIPEMFQFEIPFEGYGLGQQLHELKRMVS